MSAAVPRTSRGVTCFGNVDVPVPESLRLIEDGQKRQRKKGDVIFCILTPHDGDKRIVWNRFRLDEVNDARQMFDDLLAQGMIAHRVKRNGEPSAEVLSSFDPLLEEVSFLDTAEEQQTFPGSRLARRIAAGEEVVFLPRKQIVGG
ncbi:MAG TPA: hypothetical protein VK797_22625 [Tepidisphaeraceae bacterium]|jgi:hypothetical protein|nr:hypothetical protein [Tepidisphaeraceae bacterium]